MNGTKEKGVELAVENYHKEGRNGKEKKEVEIYLNPDKTLQTINEDIGLD